MVAPRQDLSRDEYSTLTIMILPKQGRRFWNFELRTLKLRPGTHDEPEAELCNEPGVDDVVEDATSDAEDSDGGSLDEEAKILSAAEARAPHLQDIEPPNPSAAKPKGLR